VYFVGEGKLNRKKRVEKEGWRGRRECTRARKRAGRL